MPNEKKLKNALNTLNNDEVRISGIIEESIVDGPGLRFVIFTQGCLKRCFLCHNENTQSLSGGYTLKIDDIVSKWQNNPILSGITISGGEPFLQPKKILKLVLAAKKDNLDVLIYSGYYYEELLKMKNEYIGQILKEANFLVDGPFEYKLKSLNLLFRGSSNQRIIDLKKSFMEKKVIIIESFE